MNIAGLDIGTHAGWATAHDAGTWNLTPRSHESSGIRLLKFRASLTELIRLAHLDLIGYEDAGFLAKAGASAAVVYGELLGVLKTVCEDMHVQYVGFKPAAIKKLATGKGNANKEQMLTAARRQWPGLTIPDDNTADALWTREAAVREYGQ